LPCIDFTDVSKEDITQILKIEEESFSRPWSYTSFLNELLCEQAFICAARHKNINGLTPIIAYTCYRIVENEMHILKIAVTNNWRRRGVGSLLLNKCLIEVSKKDVTAAFLEVRCANISAIAFYNKHGFTEIGRRPHYYINSDGNEDALIMMTVLKEET